MRIGITGGIGSGKTYVCDKLVKAGFPVYSCDAEAKRLMVEDISIIESLKGLVGEDVYDSQGALCKERMIAFLFSDKGNTEKVNSIVHPRVKEHLTDWFAFYKDVECVAVESAILYESGLNAMVDKVVLVYAPLEMRIQRAMSRDHATEEQIRARVVSQRSDEEKRLLADFVLYNDGKMELNSQIDSLLGGLFCKKL